MIEARLAGHRVAIVWPEKAADIDDREPQLLVAYLPLEFAGQPRSQQEAIAKELLEKAGDKPRTFRNGLGLAIPSSDLVEILRRAVRYLMAIEAVKAKAKQLNLTDDQKGQLREREATERAMAESALLKLYMEVWFPRAEAGGIALDKVGAGGRPLQTTLNEKHEAMIHERVVELITQLYRKAFDKTEPTKIIELFQLGEGNPPRLGIAVCEVVEGFFSFLGFPRLMNTAAIRKGIAKGIAEGHFGYVTGPRPAMSATGTFEVAPSKVRFKVPVAEEEIDLETGFLMLPQAIPPAAAKASAGASAVPGGDLGEATLPPSVGSPIALSAMASMPAVDRRVVLSFVADRNQLYTAWNAMANLADLAGKVTVTVEAECSSGFDKAKLQNGVFEPLREADLIQ
jgi:hypothetical protein